MKTPSNPKIQAFWQRYEDPRVQAALAPPALSFDGFLSHWLASYRGWCLSTHVSRAYELDLADHIRLQQAFARLGKLENERDHANPTGH